MDRTPEQILFELLTTGHNIDDFILDNFPMEAIPSEELRPIYSWCVQYYLDSGKKSPPTVDVFKNTHVPGQEPKTFFDLLNDYDIFLDEEPLESSNWVISELKGRFLTHTANKQVEKMVMEMQESLQSDRPHVLSQHAQGLVALGMSMEPHRTRVDLREDAGEILQAYADRKAQIGSHMGMHFGIPEIDAYTYGIHEGELAMLVAAPKLGKSFWLDRVALKEFEIGRSVALFTLENSIRMTEDRIACLATGVDPGAWSRGEAEDEDEAAIFDWIETCLRPATSPLHIIQPDPVDRTAESMVTKAKLLGCDSLIIDQLTFIEPPDSRIQRHLQIRDITHSLKAMISTGHNKMPCLLAHQINREGVKAAEKTGHYEMYHMAEGSEVERTADWVFSMFQGPDHKAINRLLLQTLASRRAIPKNWELDWNMTFGHVSVSSEVTVE